MKRRKRTEEKCDSVSMKNTRTIIRRHRSSEEERINDMLKVCLHKVCQMQDELKRNENIRDPEADGYAACVMETLRFLSSQGLPSYHPLVQNLTDKLFKRSDQES